MWRELQGVAGVKVTAYQAAEVFGGENAYRHAFTIVDVGGTKFLVDATFRQFFNPAQAVSGFEHYYMPGYIELNDEVAREYARALSGGKNTRFNSASFEISKSFNAAAEYSEATYAKYFGDDMKTLAKEIAEFKSGLIVQSALPGYADWHALTAEQELNLLVGTRPARGAVPTPVENMAPLIPEKQVSVPTPPPALPQGYADWYAQAAQEEGGLPATQRPAPPTIFESMKPLAKPEVPPEKIITLAEEPQIEIAPATPR